MNGTPSRYQAFISALFLITVVLMATQYTVYRHGPAIVIVAPFGWSQPSDISKQTEPGKPDEGAEPRAAAPDIQQPGLFVVNWDVFDQVAYKLHDAKQYPPAEMLLALLFLLALPLVLILHSRPVWPRWPQWVLVALGLTSLLGAEHFNAAVRENAQLVLTVLACFWLAGAALAEERQLKRFDLWLAALTIVLLLLAGWDYFVHVLRPPASAEVPTMVRATCASRSAYSGLMAMLLAMGFGRVVGSGNKLEGIGWSAVCGLGVCTLMNAGAVIALVVACLGMARVRGKATFVSALVFVPLAVGLATYSVGQRHVQHLAESIGFYHLEDGRRAAVEKRWLEMAASLNALEDARDVMPPTEDPATGSAEVKGKRSNLVFGVGAGLNYQKCIGSYYRSLDNPEKEEPDTYNLYLLLAVQLGLFGALAWAWLLADGMGNARRAYERLSDPELRSLALGVYGACLAILVFSVFGTVLIRGTGLMLFTLLAVGARLDRLARPGKTAAPRTEKPAAPAPEPEPVAAPEVAPGPTPEDLAWEAELAQIEREAEAAANNPPQESSKPVDDKDAQGG